MRVLIVNTTEKKGGAAVAAKRLAIALRTYGINVNMLVRDKTTKSVFVLPLKQSFTNIIRFAWERICILFANRLNKNDLFAVSIANTGVDITTLPEFKEADIIHLHWVNQGMLSLESLKKIFSSGKPVVWTMHDMWPCTGICHYARECDRYMNSCGNCPFINNGTKYKDLSYKVHNQKEKIYKQASSVVFVTCSKWLKSKAKESSILKEKEVINIPNTISTTIFCRKNKNELRKELGLPQDKKLIMFGSVKITDKRKGADYIIEACNILSKMSQDYIQRIGVVVIGQNSETIKELLPFEVYSLPYESEEMHMANIYNAVDVFAIPSLEENLPNMIMESMACGTPCVGFNIGGIPEMIDHLHNGYVAEYRSAKDFAKGLKFILFDESYSYMSDAAIRKVHECYNEETIARKYIEVYNRLTN